MMSFSKMGNALPKKLNDKMVAVVISAVLRAEHQNISSAVKKIARSTGVNMHTAKKWYEAKTAPKPAHLIMLAACYPQILQAILEMIGQQSIRQQMLAERNAQIMKNDVDSIQFDYRHDVGNRNSKSVKNTQKLNHRQLWFWGKLRRGEVIRAEDIVAFWNVTNRTAERDIAGLVRNGMAKFKGTRRSGFYTIDEGRETSACVQRKNKQ